MGTIFTHSGVFHADDVFSVAVARLAEFGPKVQRVRQLPVEFSPQNGDIAVDVGGGYEPAQHLFDHHQRNGADDGWAALGKVWNSFGPKICESERVAKRVWDTLLRSLNDADIAKKDWEPISPDLRHVSGSLLIATMNPPFGTPPEAWDAAFEVACAAASVALSGAIHQAKAYSEMRDVMLHSIPHLDGRVLSLSKGGPWQEHIFELGLDDTLYVIYPSERGGFCLQAVPDAPGSFGMRKALPAFWKGLRGAELADFTGLSQHGSATFCHPGLFIGGAETLEDTLQLAELAVEAEVINV